MAVTDDSVDLYIRVDKKAFTPGEFDQLCSLLRGLFHSNGNSNGQQVKNKDFAYGHTVVFGAATMKLEFRRSVRRFVRKSVRDHIELRDG